MERSGGVLEDVVIAKIALGIVAGMILLAVVETILAVGVEIIGRILE